MPAIADSYFEAAEKLMASGELTEARRVLEQELVLRPENLPARYDLAVLLQQLGHVEQAMALYQENMQRGWHLPTVVNLVARLRQQGEIKQAKALLLSARKHFRAEAAPYYLLADMALQKQNKVQATIYFQQALKADPLNGFAHLRYARFLAGEGNMRLARKHGERAVALQKDCAPCWKIWGDILHLAGDDKAAIEAYQHSLALSPEGNARQPMIQVLRSMGENARADVMQRAYGDGGR